MMERRTEDFVAGVTACAHAVRRAEGKEVDDAFLQAVREATEELGTDKQKEQA